MQKMLPEHRTFISSHQYNSRPSVAHAPASRAAGQPQVRQMPSRPLNVQPRSIANPFHPMHHELAKHPIYDRLHPRNLYQPLTFNTQPKHEVEVDINWSRHNASK